MTHKFRIIYADDEGEFLSVGTHPTAEAAEAHGRDVAANSPDRAFIDVVEDRTK
jgi:hypothetical protein